MDGRRLVLFGGLFVVVTGSTIGTYGVYRTMFFTPAHNPLPLADHLVPLDSPEGQAMLGRSGRADYDLLFPELLTQERPAWCGVASTAMVVNAYDEPDIEQSAVFTSDAPVSPLKVTFSGMTLDQLGDLLAVHARPAVTHAHDAGLDAFRSMVEKSQASDRELIVVNYLRAAMGQQSTGHISPVAGYDPQTDRILVLDVSTYKYPPVWVESATLYDAMNTVDRASGETRGYVVVYPGPGDEP